MRKIPIIGICIVLLSACAYANKNSDVTGTWVKSCSFDPIPGGTKPNHSTVTATLGNHHIDIEVNYFTDSACQSPWRLMPTFLQSGTYRVGGSHVKKRLGGKKELVTPVHVHITRYDNHAKFSPGRDFTVYYNDFDTVYFRLHNRLYTLHKAINEPKARLAEEVYQQHDGTKVCIISRKVRSYTFSWCLENVSFPPSQFKAYCDASSVGEDTSVRYTNVCPPELMSASCLYGLQHLGHNFRRWYPEEELKTNPLAQKACVEQLHGTWNK